MKSYLVLLIVSSVVTITQQIPNPTPRVCYYGDWAKLWKAPAGLTVPKLNPYLCTHIILAFARVNETHQIDLYTEEQKQAFASTSILRRKNPDLKILIAVGGWRHGGVPFTNMARTREGRQTFVESVGKFLTEYNMDGINIDWEFPEGRIALFSFLLKDLKMYSHSHSTKEFLVTAAVSGIPELADHLYNYTVLGTETDFIVVTSYDYHSHWRLRSTGHHSALKWDPENRTMAAAAMHYLNQGVPKQKIIMGFPIYARTFILSSSNTRPGAHISGAPDGYYTKNTGLMAYYEVCAFYLGRGATYVWDAKAFASYAYKRNLWFSFDSKQSYCHKLKWLQKNGFRGWMVWTMDQDDHTNFCREGCYPMIRYLNETVAKDLTNEDCDRADLIFTNLT